MSTYLNILQQVKDNSKQIVVIINGGEKLVTITDITDDAVTLEVVNSNDRYDLHFTQVIIAGSK